MSTPRIVFFGTPDFAVPTLERLHRDWSVTAVVTAPDTPAGRGRTMTPPAVKRAASQLGITHIAQPHSLRDEAFVHWLCELAPDVICVLAFRILPSVLLRIPHLAFNVHPSLLPRHRGPAPIAHTIIAGDRQTGVTTFVLSDRVDAGMILLQRHIDIPDGMTAGELASLLAPLCADLASQTIAAWQAGTLVPQPQDESRATYAPKLYPENAWIDWQRAARTVRNYIHGYSPEPGAWTLLDGTRVKIYRARIISQEPHNELSGSWQMERTQWLVYCGSGVLALQEVQLPGKRIMHVEEFLRGWRGVREGIFRFPQETTP